MLTIECLWKACLGSSGEVKNNLLVILRGRRLPRRKLRRDIRSEDKENVLVRMPKQGVPVNIAEPNGKVYVLNGRNGGEFQ